MWSTLTKDKTYLKSEILATKIRMTEICRVLLVTLLLCLFWLPSDDAEENESFGGTFSVKDYTSWLKKHKIQLFNYAVEVNETVVIWSPVLPVPKGLHWSSLNMENEMPASSNHKLGLAYSHYFDKFLKTYNQSWARVFAFDRLNRNLRIQQVNLGYADMYRLHVDENKKNTGRKKMSKDQDFDVAITLMTYTSHECEVKGGPQSPKQGDMFVMSCSVVVNGLWNTSLVFRNTFDRNEIRGNVSKCNRQPSVGSRICSTVRVKAEADILAYTCELEFLPERREDPKNPMFQNSKWTTRFNKEVVCYLPKIYLKEVSDNISSAAHGYPQPVKDLQITKDNSAPMIHEEESEALKRMVEHVEKIEKHINDGGIVKHALNNNVHSLLNGTINASMQLLKMGRGKDGALGEGEEVDTTLGRTFWQNFSEMIDAISKHVHDINNRLAGISATAASENGEPLPEIAMQDLKEALTELEREIRTVGDKVHEILNSILTEVTVPEENSFTNDEESEEDHEQLIDEVYELTVQFMDAYNFNMGEEKVKELYDSIVQNYEFPGLEYKSHVFMDSEEMSDSDDEASTVETASPAATEDLTGDTQGMPETASPMSTTEAIPTSTAESPAGSREAGNDTESDSASEEKGDAVIPDNTTEAVSDGEGTTEVLNSNMNDTETDKSPLATDLLYLIDEDVREQETTTDWNSDASDSGKAKPELEPEEREDRVGEDGEERDDKEEENDKDKEEGKVEENEKAEEEGSAEETDAASERVLDGEVTSGTSESVEKAFKVSEAYEAQAKEVRHLEVSGNASKTPGRRYSTKLLQVSSPTQKSVSSTINPTQPNKYQTMSQVTAEKEPDEPDKEPVESSTEPAESVKEPDQPGKEPVESSTEPVESVKEPDAPDRKPVEYTREVTEESQFSQMHETEMEHSDVKDEYETSTRYSALESNGTQETFELKEDTRGGSLILDSGSVDEDVTTKPKDAAEAAGDFGADGNFAYLKDGNKMDAVTSRACRDALDRHRQLQQFISTRCKDGNDEGGGSSSMKEGGGSSSMKEGGGSSSMKEGGGSSSMKEGGGSSSMKEGGGSSSMKEGDPADGNMMNQMNEMTCQDMQNEQILLQKVLSTRCKGGPDGVSKGGEGDCRPCVCDAGRHVQSVVLELFLLIFGACLTRIEL